MRVPIRATMIAGYYVGYHEGYYELLERRSCEERQRQYGVTILDRALHG